MNILAPVYGTPKHINPVPVTYSEKYGDTLVLSILVFRPVFLCGIQLEKNQPADK